MNNWIFVSVAKLKKSEQKCGSFRTKSDFFYFIFCYCFIFSGQNKKKWFGSNEMFWVLIQNDILNWNVHLKWHFQNKMLFQIDISLWKCHIKSIFCFELFWHFQNKLFRCFWNFCNQGGFSAETIHQSQPKFSDGYALGVASPTHSLCCHCCFLFLMC